MLLVIAMGVAACDGGKSAREDVDAAQAGAETPAGSAPAQRAVAAITADDMRRNVIELANDKFEGRGPGSRGDEAARDYLIAEMQEMGLQPGAADGGWQQRFDLVGITAEQPEVWTFTKGVESLTFKQWDQFIAGSGVQEERVAFEDAEVVFVGYGITAPEYDWDDYAGQDLSGKLVLIVNNDPAWDADLFGGESRLWYGRWDYKYLNAARHGAVGAIIIHTTPSAGYPFQVVQTSWTGEQFELPAGDEARSQVEAWLTEESSRALVKMAGHDLDELRTAADNRDFEPVPLGITTSLAMDVSLNRVSTANVLGLIPGSDPGLKDEAVIYTAHHDHLGIGTPDATGDKIYNGAMDNASGVAQVLAIVRAITALPEPPRRSILVAMVGAEEQGFARRSGFYWFRSV
jgi:hypothetical protein